jgi:hypothetical protein
MNKQDETKGVACPACGCTRSKTLKTVRENGETHRMRRCQNEECRRWFKTREVVVDDI